MHTALSHFSLLFFICIVFAFIYFVLFIILLQRRLYMTNTYIYVLQTLSLSCLCMTYVQDCHTYMFFFLIQTLPPGSVCDENSFFCQLKKAPEGRRTVRQAAGGWGWRRLTVHAHTHTLYACACVFSAWQRVGFQTVRGLVTWKR